MHGEVQAFRFESCRPTSGISTAPETLLQRNMDPRERPGDELMVESEISQWAMCCQCSRRDDGSMETAVTVPTKEDGVVLNSWYI